MPRPPPGLWRALEMAYHEGATYLSAGPPKVARSLRDLSSRRIAANALRFVTNTVIKPIARPTPSATPLAHASPYSTWTAPSLRLLPKSSLSPAPLRRGAHMGGRPAFASPMPKTAQVGLQRGFHAAAGRQVFQNVVENAPLGLRSLWEVEWKADRGGAGRGLVKSKKQRSQNLKALKVESIPTLVREADATTVSSTAQLAAAFETYFPAAPQPPTALLTLSLAPSSPLPSLGTSAFSHPLLPHPLLAALRYHDELSTTHSLRVKGLLDRIPTAAFKGSWIGPGPSLVLRVEASVAERVYKGRESWLLLQDEPTPLESVVVRSRDVEAWAAEVANATQDAEDGDGGLADLSTWSLDSVPATEIFDAITHERVAGLFVMPTLTHPETDQGEIEEGSEDSGETFLW